LLLTWMLEEFRQSVVRDRRYGFVSYHSGMIVV
jgi:hypothetical protein